MTDLRYRLARRDDQKSLQSFECATPFKYRTIDPEPWAREVQAWIRADALTDTRKNSDPPRSQRLLLFEMENAGQTVLCGVSSYFFWDIGAEPPVSCHLPALAVARDLRGVRIPSGVTVADFVLQATLTEIQSASGAATIVSGLVDPRNSPCLRLLTRHGFEKQQWSDPDYQLWAIRISASED